MKKLFLIIMITVFNIASMKAEIIEFAYDSGTPRSGHQASSLDWEESAFLKPDGPCNISQIKIYLTGNEAAVDTFYVVGDPAEGAISPTMWVLHYNTVYEPIIIEYDGTPGWRTVDVEGLRSDGMDRLWIQHKVNANGPWMAADDDGNSNPVNSYLMNPYETNSLGGPGQYYLANGNFMVRFMLEYDYPDGQTSAPPPPPVMPDVSNMAGLVNNSGDNMRADMVTAADWNGDGWDDIAIGGNLFENNGDGTFKKIDNQGISAFGTVWADVDNDGYMDCFAGRGNGNDRIHWGKADGTLEEETDSVVILEQPTVTPMWLDYDHDGLLDLYIAYGRSGSYPNEVFYADQLFRNLGDRKFENVTVSAGIAAGEPAPHYDCWGASICDYNGDNWPDIFVATYRLAPDLLFKNNQDGTFSEVGAQTGARGVPTQQAGFFGHGMGSDWGDYNNDGFMDFAVGNLGHPDWRGAVSNPSMIFRNDGPPDYNFTNVKQELGLKFFEMNAGIVWADLDNDKWLDLFHCQYSYDRKGSGVDRLSRLYMNQGPDEDYKLLDKTWEYGSIIHGAWCPVRLDFDNDGDMDILVGSAKEYVMLFRNDLPRSGNWIEFRLTGSPADGVGNDALGSSVEVTVGTLSMRRDLPGSVMTGRAAQASNVLHFGLGEAAIADNVMIIFPDGKEVELNNLDANNIYKVGYDGSVETLLIATPAQKLPKNFSYNNPQSLTLEWYLVGSAEEYLIQLSDKSDFSNIINEETSNTNSLELGALEQNQTYHWRIKAVGESSESAWSAGWSFTVGMPLPTAPQLIAPENNARDHTQLPKFEWGTVSYPIKLGYSTTYELIVSKDTEFNEIDFETITDQREYTMEQPLESDLIYFWKVRALNHGTPGPWSDIWNFKTMPLPAPPLLKTPEDGEQDVKLKPQFMWEKSELANSYHFQLAFDVEFENLEYEKERIALNRTSIISGITPDTVFYWHVRGINDGGPGEWSETRSFRSIKVNSVGDNPVPGYFLFANAPNPCDGWTTFSFKIPDACKVRLEIFDALGNEIDVPVSKVYSAGAYEYNWNAGGLPSGIYFYRMTAAKFVSTKVMMILK